MVSTIEKLWNGELSPCKNITANSPELAELSSYMQRHLDRLEQLTSPEQKKIFENYLSCAEEHLYFTALYAFNEGFSLATLLLTEAFSHDLHSKG